MAHSLEKAFQTAVDLFNHCRYDELGGMCDPDVIMKKVDDPGSIVGLGNLVVYLNTQQKVQEPKFSKIHIEHRIEKGNLGIISGRGEYLDNITTGLTIAVNFSFVFTRDDEADDWSLINAFAVPSKD